MIIICETGNFANEKNSLQPHSPLGVIKNCCGLALERTNFIITLNDVFDFTFPQLCLKDDTPDNQ